MSADIDLPLELIAAWPKLSPYVQHMIVEMAKGFAELEPAEGFRKALDLLEGRFPTMRADTAKSEAVEAEKRRRQAEQEFLDLGFRKRVARALAVDGYDIPRLLAVERRELTWIPNIGRKGLAEIDAFREARSRT